jgi:hypothetical protein
MGTMRSPFLLILAATVACTSSSGSVCPSSFVVELDTTSRFVYWDSVGAQAQLSSVVGDCLPVHTTKNRVEDSTTYYRVPITATVHMSVDSISDTYLMYIAEEGMHFAAPVRVEALGANGVVLRSDTIPFVFKLSREDHRIVGALDHLSPAEIAHVARVRVGFRGMPER